MQYYFKDKNRNIMPSIVQSLKDNGFEVKESYDYIEEGLRYNFITISWDK